MPLGKDDVTLRDVIAMLGSAMSQGAPKSELDAIRGNTGRIAISLEKLEKSLAEAGERLLRHDIIEVLQDENSRLMVANARLIRCYRMLHELVADVNRHCLSCRKLAGEPHKPGCEWAPMTLEALDKKLEEEAGEVTA